ncbi:hypothetical protein SAMN04488518_13212, partial [Pseudovibrio ascidiaceicola]
TLTFSDIDDHDKQSNIGGSIGVNFTVPGSAGADKSGETGPEDQPDNTSDQTDSEESEAETSYGGQFEGSYANRDKRQITRATVGEGEIIIRDEDKQQELEDSGETENVAELNRDVDLAQEITKDEEEYVGVYVSDTAVVAVIEAGKKIGEVIDQVKKSLIASEQLSPEEASIGAKVYSDLLDKKIPPESLRACLSSSASIWDWIISSAHASTACSVYSIQEIKACLKFYDTVKYAAAESSANMLEQFNVAYENDPEGLEKALKALDIPTEIILKSGLVDKQAYEKFQEDISAAVTKGTDEVLATIEQYSNGDPEKAVILATLVTGTALALAPKKTRAKILEKLKEPLKKVASNFKKIQQQRLLWGSWGDYPKITIGNRTYAQIGKRKYSQHAVDRMQPSGLGAPVGSDGPGRNVTPNMVEEVIANGSKSTVIKDGVKRTIFTSGNVSVVTESNESVIVTILRNSSP